MEHLDLRAMRCAFGGVTLPGSKSISNRVLLLAALAEGVTEIRNLLASDDTERMIDALNRLGVGLECRDTGPSVRVTGTGGAFRVRQAELFLGNAGTVFRPLTAVLAFSGGNYRLFGTTRMHERPIGDLVDGLRQLGAEVGYLGNEGYPPLEIRPAAILTEPRHRLQVRLRGDVSSQFLTGLLMALPLTGAPAEIDIVGQLISRPYVAMTIELMGRFGIRVERDGWRAFRVPGAQCYRSPGTFLVEGDASSASYFLAAGAIGGGPVRVEGVGAGSIQGDVRLIDELQRMGARIATGDTWIEARSPVPGSARPLQPLDADLNHIPDAAMTLAVVALFAQGTSILRNIASWRAKETDRISAMATELRKAGADVEDGEDYIRITPPERLRAATIATYDDHRMAMCFSLLCLGGVPVRIQDPGCVAKTFPDYFERIFGILAADPPVIAIDGPSASGKGTVAAEVARRLGFHYLDSGALYRLVALAALHSDVSLSDEERLAALAADLWARFEGEQIFLGEHDVTQGIRSEEVSVAASQVAALGGVRSALLQRQRNFRAFPGLVADGRDMGTVVFPDARLKVFLTASVEARAQRRHKQLMEKGLAANIDSLAQDLRERDARDSARSVSPLQRCADAELIDTTGMTIDQAVEALMHLVFRSDLRRGAVC